MQQNILHRLISARHLLENSSPVLNQHSDPRSVAQAVLTAHDASELTLAAICDHLATGLSDRATFPELVGKVDSTLSGGLQGRSFFERMNRVRVAFKHRGELPDASTWFDVLENALEYLNETCLSVFAVQLTSVDTSHLIVSISAQAALAEAKQQIAVGNFREAFESVAKGIEDANETFPLNIWITAGDPDTQMALLLTGFGIEPATFITLQQYLPRTGIEGPKWAMREFGHTANWTEANAKFCLEASINLILRLQSAKGQPVPLKFQDVYRDVVTILIDEPQIRHGHFLSGALTFSLAPNPFKKGDVIYGHVTASIDEHGTITDAKWDIDDSQWVKVESFTTERLGQDLGYLVFRKQDVAVRFEEDPNSWRAVQIRRAQEGHYENA